MRPAGDRRDRVRFEVFGSFWGTLDVGEPVRVLDLSTRGALIESLTPLAVESIQSVKLTIDGQAAITDAQVKHVRAVPIGPSGHYLVGMEFVGAPSAFLDAAERLAASRSIPTESA